MPKKIYTYLAIFFAILGFFFFSPQQASADIITDLEAYYSFDGVLTDPISGLDFIPSGTIAYGSGISGLAFNSTGSNSNIFLNFPSSYSTFTASYWMKDVDSSSVIARFTDFGDLYMSHSTFTIGIVGTPSGSQINFTSSYTGYSRYLWNHHSFTISGTVLSYYINGELVTTYSHGSMPHPNALSFGRLGQVAISDYLFDEVFIYSRALSASDILELYHLQVPPEPDPTCGDTPNTCGYGYNFQIGHQSETSYDRNCVPNDGNRQNSFLCSLPLTGLTQYCGSYNDQYFIGGLPIDPTTTGADVPIYSTEFCLPDNGSLSYPEYNANSNARSRQCYNVENEETSFCSARGSFSEQPICGSWNNRTFSTGYFTRDYQSLTGRSDVYCANGTRANTGEVYGNRIYLDGLYTGHMQWSWQCKQIDNQGVDRTAYCSSNVAGGPLDPSELAENDDFFRNNPFFGAEVYGSDRCVLPQRYQRVVDYLDLQDIVYNICTLLDMSPTVLNQLHFAAPTINNDLSFGEVPITVSLDDFMLFECDDFECTYEVIGHSRTSQTTFVHKYLPSFLGFVFVGLIVGFVFLVVFGPFLLLYKVVRIPMLFMSVNHIDTGSTVVGGLLRLTSIALISTIFFGIGILLVTMLLPILSGLKSILLFVLSIPILLIGGQAYLLEFYNAIFYINFFIVGLTIVAVVKLIANSLKIPGIG